VYHYGPSENLTVRNCVFWNDGGSIALIGIADNKGDIRNVTMEKCDILTSQGVWTGENAAAIHIAATAGNTISGVVFRDVRIEPFRFPSTTALLMIKAKEFKIGVHRYPPGRVSDVLFDRVTYDGGGETPSFIQGTDADHAVKGVVFKDFKWGDSLLSLENRPNLQVRQFSEVTFFPAAPIWITDFSPPADPIEIKSISKITEPTWPDGSLYWAFSLTLDQPVGSDKFNNNMQRGGDEQADPLLKQAVRENIKLDGKTLGELLTLHKDEWAVMVTYKENLITIIAKKAFPILTQDSGHRVEIRPGLLDITKSKHFKGATYSYDGVSRAWSMTKAPPSSDGR
jgi:hypothetical protein